MTFAIEHRYGVEIGDDWLPWHYRSRHLDDEIVSMLPAMFREAVMVIDQHPDWWYRFRLYEPTLPVEIIKTLEKEGFMWSTDRRKWQEMKVMDTDPFLNLEQTANYDDTFSDLEDPQRVHQLESEVERLKAELDNVRNESNKMIANVEDQRDWYLRRTRELQAMHQGSADMRRQAVYESQVFDLGTLEDACNSGKRIKEFDAALTERHRQGWTLMREMSATFFEKGHVFRALTFTRSRDANIWSESIERAAKSQKRAVEAEEEASEDASYIASAEFTFEEALASGQFSARELAQIGDAEVLDNMKRAAQGSHTRLRNMLPALGRLGVIGA